MPARGGLPAKVQAATICGTFSSGDHPEKGFDGFGSLAAPPDDAVERSPDGQSGQRHDLEPPRLQLKSDRQPRHDRDANPRGHCPLDCFGARHREDRASASKTPLASPSARAIASTPPGMSRTLPTMSSSTLILTYALTAACALPNARCRRSSPSPISRRSGGHSSRRTRRIIGRVEPQRHAEHRTDSKPIRAPLARGFSGTAGFG